MDYSTKIVPMTGVLMLLAVGCARSQEGRSQESAPPPQQSVYLGRPIIHPEDLSGIWEAPDGKGGAVGIELLLLSTAPVTATTLVGVQQSWLSLDIGLYERQESAIRLGERNFFSDARPGMVQYDGDRLSLHYSTYDLDVVRGSGNSWTGRFHRNGFDSKVTLRRSIASRRGLQPWFIGTWRMGDAVNQRCLHIVEPAPGEFMGWSDSLLAWGLARFAPGVSRPPYSLEQYGNLAKVNAMNDGSVSVELNAYTAMCCSHTFRGSRMGSGAVLQADWPEGMNQSPHKDEWVKMPGSTCIVQIP